MATNSYTPDYGMYFFGITFQELIEQYEGFESKVEYDLVNVIKLFLTNNATEVRGEIFSINNIQIKVQPRFPRTEFDRKFELLLFAPYLGTPQLLEKEIYINAIGRIRRIWISYPRGLTKVVEKLLILISDSIVYAYSTFEVAFKSKFVKFYERVVINEIYDRIFIEALRINKPHLRSNFWITLSKIESTSTGKFVFAFDSFALAKYIDALKARQLNCYSPFQLILSLLLEETPDNGMEQFNSGNLDLMLNFNSIKTAFSDYQSHWNGEVILYKEKEFGFIYASQKDDYLLSISYSKSYAKDVKELVLSIADDITQIFEEKIKGEMAQIRFKKRINWAIVYKEGKDIITSIGGKAVAEIAGG